MSETAIHQAIVAKLAGDSALAVAAPGGVTWDLAPQGAPNPYVIVTVTDDADEQVFSGTAYEVLFATIEALDSSTSVAGVDAAYSRIHALMQDTALTITGFTLMKCVRRRKYRSVIEDGDRRIQQLGGVYELWASPTT